MIEGVNSDANYFPGMYDLDTNELREFGFGKRVIVTSCFFGNSLPVKTTITQELRNVFSQIECVFLSVFTS